MGKLGGFLQIERHGIPQRDPRRARARLPRVPAHASGRGAARAGRPLHGLRRAVLPQRLPARQPDPRLERPRLPRPLRRRDRAAARDQQLPRVHRPSVPRAVRGGLRARDPRGRRGHDQADRERDHQPRLGGGLGGAPARRDARPARRWPSSARARRAWQPPSSCAAPATASRCSSATRRSAGSCASACPTSRSRRRSCSGASSS